MHSTEHLRRLSEHHDSIAEKLGDSAGSAQTGIGHRREEAADIKGLREGGVRVVAYGGRWAAAIFVTVL